MTDAVVGDRRGGSSATVMVRLSDLDGDEERLELATVALRAELLELEVDDVVPVTAGKAPPGTRAVDVSTVGKLLVVVPRVYESLRNLVMCVQQWLARDAVGRGSLLVSSHFAYIGTAVYSIDSYGGSYGGVPAWFLLAQVAATLVTAVPSLLITSRVASATS
jgi:hypothetical protein